MISILTPELEKHAEETRAFRKRLALERCQCPEKCDVSEVHECDTCRTMEPECRIASTREVVECQKCSDAREAYWARECRTYVPQPTDAEAAEIRKLKGMER